MRIFDDEQEAAAVPFSSLQSEDRISVPDIPFPEVGLPKTTKELGKFIPFEDVGINESDLPELVEDIIPERIAFQSTLGNISASTTSFFGLVKEHVKDQLLLIPAVIEKGIHDFSSVDPDFNPETLPYIDNPQYSAIKSVLLGAKDQHHADFIKENFDRDFRFQQIRDNAGWAKDLLAAIASGAVNPIIWFFPYAKAASLAAKGTYSVGKTALIGAGINAGVSVPYALGKVYTNELYNGTTAFLDISANSILGAIAGASGKLITTRAFKKNADKLKKTFVADPVLEEKVLNKENFDEFLSNIKENQGPREANRLVKGLSNLSIGRTVLSENPDVADVAKRMFNWGSSEGKQNVQTLASLLQSRYLSRKNKIMNGRYEEWLRHMNKDTVGRKVLRALDLDQQRKVFNREVGIATSLGDKSDNPVVQSASQDLRVLSNEVVDIGMEVDFWGVKAGKILAVKEESKPIKQELANLRKEFKEKNADVKLNTKQRDRLKEVFKREELSLKKTLEKFDEGITVIENTKFTHKDLPVKFAESYGNRIYDTKKIRDDPDGLRDIFFEDWFRKELESESYIEELTKLKKAAKQAKDDLDAELLKQKTKPFKSKSRIAEQKKLITRLKRRATSARKAVPRLEAETSERIQKAVNQTIRKLSKFPGDFSPVSTFFREGRPSATKSRTITTEDRLLMDYLVKDADIMYDVLFKSLLPAIEMKREFGTANFQVIKSKLSKDFEARLNKRKLPEGKRSKLMDKFDDELLDLESGWMRILNLVPFDNKLLTNKSAMMAIRTSRSLTHALKAGFFPLNAAMDIQNQVYFFGLRKTFAAHLHNLVSSISSPGAFKKNMELLQELGLASGNVNHMRTDVLNELQYGSGSSKVELGSKWLANIFFKSLMIEKIDAWNQGVSNYLFVQHLRSIAKGKASSKDISNLAFFGIAKEDIPRIVENLDKHGFRDKRSGLFIANINEWDADMELKMSAALKKVEESTVILPGAADLPRLFDNPVWSLFLTYKRFIFAATQKLTVPALMGQEVAYGQAFLFAWGMGMLNETVRDLSSGRDVEDIDQLALGGLKHVDLFGVLPAGYNMALTAIGSPSHVRYGNDIIDELAGPVGGTVKDIFKGIGTGIKHFDPDEPWTSSDKNNFRKLVPLSGHWALRGGINGMLGIDWKDNERLLKKKIEKKRLKEKL